MLPGEADHSPLSELFLAWAAVVADEPSLASVLGERMYEICLLQRYICLSSFIPLYRKA